MTKATLTRFPGVHRRSDSGIYQFGLRAPADLLAHFPSGWAIRQSLGTSDLRTANEKAKALQAEWAQKFDVLRSGKPAPVDLSGIREALFRRFETMIKNVDAQYGDLVGEARLERAQMLRLQIDEARDGQREGFVPDWIESRIVELGFPRSSLVDAEVQAHVITMLEVRYEALTDETRTFPLRLGVRRGHLAWALSE